MATIYASIRQGTQMATVIDMIRACDGELGAVVGRSGYTEIHVADPTVGINTIRLRNTLIDGPILEIRPSPKRSFPRAPAAVVG